MTRRGLRAQGARQALRPSCPAGGSVDGSSVKLERGGGSGGQGRKTGSLYRRSASVPSAWREAKCIRERGKNLKAKIRKGAARGEPRRFGRFSASIGSLNRKGAKAEKARAAKGIVGWGRALGSTLFVAPPSAALCEGSLGREKVET